MGRGSSGSHTKRRVFIAAPISAFSDEREYQSFRSQVVDFAETIERNPGIEAVYCAARNISSFDHFSGSDNALMEDLENLLASHLFVLFYPKKVVSSVTVEAGVALGTRKPMLFFVNRAGDLPYILRAPHAFEETSFIPPIEIVDLNEKSPSRSFENWLSKIQFETSQGILA